MQPGSEMVPSDSRLVHQPSLTPGDARVSYGWQALLITPDLACRAEAATGKTEAAEADSEGGHPVRTPPAHVRTSPAALRISRVLNT